MNFKRRGSLQNRWPVGMFNISRADVRILHFRNAMFAKRPPSAVPLPVGHWRYEVRVVQLIKKQMDTANV